MTDVSIIIPVHNGEKWINNCMKSIITQTAYKEGLKVEIIAFDDGSTDSTKVLLEEWRECFEKYDIPFIITGSTTSRGVGAAKNGAIKQSSGQFLCFQDIDDVMHPERIYLQWKAAKSYTNAIIGSQISRAPVNSTPRLVAWANNVEKDLLQTQIYTSNGPTLLMPTWFCHRCVYDRVGGFDESGKGTPEDLIFFYNHLDAGGELHRINKQLLIYTYHEDAATFSVNREKIWRIQLNRLEKVVLPYWERFTIWNAGKAGRRLVRSLNPDNLKKVIAFCDVDKNKVGRTIELYCPHKRQVYTRVPVIHFRDAKPPLLVCMKLDHTNGQFESNLKSLNLKEGIDFILFN